MLTMTSRFSLVLFLPTRLRSGGWEPLHQMLHLSRELWQKDESAIRSVRCISVCASEPRRCNKPKPEDTVCGSMYIPLCYLQCNTVCARSQAMKLHQQPVCVRTEHGYCLLIPVTSPPCIVLAASSRFSPFSCLLPLIACAMAAMHRTIISTQSRIDNLDCSAIGQEEREKATFSPKRSHYRPQRNSYHV